jgi:hypothetical protein
VQCAGGLHPGAGTRQHEDNADSIGAWYVRGMGTVVCQTVLTHDKQKPRHKGRVLAVWSGRALPFHYRQLAEGLFPNGIVFAHTR